MIDISRIYNRRNASIGVLQSAYHRLVMFVSNKYLPSRRRPSKTQGSSANNIAIPSTYVDGVFLHGSKKRFVWDTPTERVGSINTVARCPSGNT